MSVAYRPDVPEPLQHPRPRQLVTREYVGGGWHFKWFIIGFLTGGIGWFIWPFAYRAKTRPRTVTRWE